LNFAIRTEPDGHDWLPPFSCDDVVEISPASTSTAPSSMAPTPIRVDRLLLSEYEAVFTLTFSGSRADSEKTLSSVHRPLGCRPQRSRSPFAPGH